MAGSGNYTGSIFYLGRIHYYLVHDAFQWNSSEKKKQLFVFVRRIFFQLHHTVRQWRTAHADLLYEKRKDFHSGVNGNPDDRDYSYKLVLVVIGIGIAIFGRGFLHKYLEGILPVFYLGLVLNIFCVTFMTILVFHPLFAKAILVKGMKLLERLHLMKKKGSRLKKLEDSMDTYRDTAAYLKNNPTVIVKVIGITFIQRMALFAVTWFVYQSFGLHGTGFWEILFLQAVISVSVDMLPLPGGMGISETLFLTIFKPVFGTLLLPGMVLSRGLGYYGELLISAIFTVVAQLTI